MAPSSTSPPSLAHQPAFRPADAGDTPGIRRLLRESPFGRRISLTLEPHPEHPPPLTDPTRRLTIVASRPAKPRSVLGLAQRDVHFTWFDRQPSLIGYVGQLRRKQGEKITLRRLAEGFHLLAEQRRPNELSFDFTSILSDNHPARRLLERGLPGLPRYEPAGTMATLTFASSRAARKPTGEVQPLAPEHHREAFSFLQGIFQARQLAPRLTPAAFASPGLHWFVATRNGQITGCAALWDQQAFKTLTIAGYAPALRRLRIPLNLARRVLGSPPLPPVGHHLPVAFVSFLATAPDDVETTTSLLAASARAARERMISYLSLGLPADHPALPVLRRRFHPELINSEIYLVHPLGQDLTAPALSTPVHPEIALL